MSPIIEVVEIKGQVVFVKRSSCFNEKVKTFLMVFANVLFIRLAEG